METHYLLLLVEVATIPKSESRNRHLEKCFLQIHRLARKIL